MHAYTGRAAGHGNWVLSCCQTASCSDPLSLSGRMKGMQHHLKELKHQQDATCDGVTFFWSPGAEEQTASRLGPCGGLQQSEGKTSV